MASSILLPIAFTSKIFDDFSMDKLEPLMLTKKYKIENECKYLVNDGSIFIETNHCSNLIEGHNEEEVEKERAKEFIEPKQHDSLFWCLYIIVHGYAEYKQVGHNYGVKELEEKQKYIAYLKENKLAVKNTNYKVTNVAIQEMQSEFMTVQKKTSFLCLIAMSVYYNINIFIIDEAKSTMLEFLSNKDIVDTKSYVLYTTKFGKYKCGIENLSTSTIMEFREKYIVLDSYLRPLKAASNYKVDELEAILKKLGKYDENKKYKKQELYDRIHEIIG